MKKFLLLGTLAVLGLSFGSCKKKWNCTCEFKLAGRDTAIAYSYPEMSRSDAHDACDAQETTWRNADPNAECEVGD